MSDITTDDGNDDVQLEDMTIDLEATDATESPASDKEAKEVSEAETDANNDATADDDSDETDSEEEADADTEATETDPEEARKEAARQAFYERKATREQQDAQLAAVQAQELQQFAEEVGYDQEQIAFKQQQQAFYQTAVSTNTDRLTAQIDQARTIPAFQNMSPTTERAFNDAIDEFLVKNVTVDALGNPVRVQGSLYDHLQVKADLIEGLKRDGARIGKSNLAKQRAGITPKPGGSPKSQKVDKDLADFEAAWQ